MGLRNSPTAPGAERREQHAAYEVVALRYGTLRSTRSELYYAWETYGEPDGPQDLDYYFYVLRSPKLTVLIDTGFAPDSGLRRGRTCLIEPAEALERVGVEPSDVDVVILTHLHYDHVGNVALFRNATVFVPERELTFWRSPVARRPPFDKHVDRRPIDWIAREHAAGRARTYTGPVELADGIEAIAIGGHSPGQHAIVVRGRGGPVVLASDAVHLYGELEHDRPFSLVVDLEQMYLGYDRLRALADERAGTLVPGHDPEVAARFPPLDDDGIAVVLG